MKVLLLHYDPKFSARFSATVHALAQGIEKQGHEVSVIEARKDIILSGFSYDYIAVGSSASSIFSCEMAETLCYCLRTFGNLLGKRSYAFIQNYGFRRVKFLKALMGFMESEGMYLKRSDIISSKVEAESVGSRLHIEKLS